MPSPQKPKLCPGKVYRTREFTRWGANPARLAKRLVQEGSLKKISHGLFFRPRKSKFGEVPPSDSELMRGLLDGGPFIFTGPEKWNSLGFGSTALYATRLVYNTKRSGHFNFNGRRFQLRRVEFPRQEVAEWYVVDLLENASKAGISKDLLLDAIESALKSGRFNSDRLIKMATRYGSKNTECLLKKLAKGIDVHS